MAKTIKITVTQTDIDNGKQDSILLSPLAYAIKRACPRWKSIEVGTRYVFYDYKGEECLFTYLPPNAQKFVLKYYRGERVRPFSFKLQADA